MQASGFGNLQLFKRSVN